LRATLKRAPGKGGSGKALQQIIKAIKAAKNLPQKGRLSNKLFDVMKPAFDCLWSQNFRHFNEKCNDKEPLDLYRSFIDILSASAAPGADATIKVLRGPAEEFMSASQPKHELTSSAAKGAAPKADADPKDSRKRTQQGKTATPFEDCPLRQMYDTKIVNIDEIGHGRCGVAACSLTTLKRLVAADVQSPSPLAVVVKGTPQ